jgi:hypothetical protein
MKKYKVYWIEVDLPPLFASPKKRTISAKSPEDAYRKFLESETESKNLAVAVQWGLLGDQVFKNHIVAEDQRSQKGGGVSDSVQVNFDLVERHSAWSVLQFLCGVLCIIAGCIFVGDNEEITGIAFIAIGVQALFIGFLINVFTDIRWFLQESLKIQRDRKR